MTRTSDLHYSATVHTNDIAVLHCLRGLAEYAEESHLKHVAWGGTTRDYWEKHGHWVKFHFSSTRCRECFKNEAARLLPSGSWNWVKMKDDDPPAKEEERKLKPPPDLE